MGYKIREDHVVIRTTLGFRWIWELITADGHTAAVSAHFNDRDACEAEARKHGLPMIGARKSLKGPKGKRRLPGLRIFNNGCGVWVWEDVSDDGTVTASSTTGFLTRDECERDLERRMAAQARERIAA